jgi:hypothetical protein
MKNHVPHLLALSFIILISGCASKPEKADLTQASSGFLMNYDLLTPVASSEDMQMYIYKNPNADQDDYYAAIVEPVFIYDGATGESDVTSQNIENARHGIDAGLQRIVRNKYQITNTPGPGVFLLQVAITGATLETQGFKPWNIIPVSAAITLASHATGLENKKPVLVVELKITDSQTGEILREILTTSSGENFRQESNTSSEFENLANQWVKLAVEYSQKNN